MVAHQIVGPAPVWAAPSLTAAITIMPEFLLSFHSSLVRAGPSNPRLSCMVSVSAAGGCDRPSKKKNQHPACAVCSKALVLFKLRWAPPDGFCFPIYGLAATTRVWLPEFLKGKERLSKTPRTLQGVAITVDGPRPRSNR